jgi:hypothetical protein
MIGTEKLEEILESTLCTGRIKDETPVSLLIVSYVGAGKSDLVRHYPDNCVDSVLYASDITAFAIHKKFGKALRTGRIRHIIIPDLLVPLNKQKEQAGHFITFMNGIIEEGIAKVISRESDFRVDFPVRCGLITTLAREELVKRRNNFATVGFMSRMLPVSYQHSPELIHKIFESIKERKYKEDKVQRLEMPQESEVDLPKDIADCIEPLANRLKDPSDKYGYRRLHQLQTLSMGHALLNKRMVVDYDDVLWLWELEDFFYDDCRKNI